MLSRFSCLLYVFILFSGMLLSVQTFSDDLLSGSVSPTGSLRVSQTVKFNYDIEIQRIFFQAEDGIRDNER
eukprot:COSAG02_NODE_47579_length_340_cov_0.709544_1_plen_71_part_00